MNGPNKPSSERVRHLTAAAVIAAALAGLASLDWIANWHFHLEAESSKQPSDNVD